MHRNTLIDAAVCMIALPAFVLALALILPN